MSAVAHQSHAGEQQQGEAKDQHDKDSDSHVNVKFQWPTWRRVHHREDNDRAAPGYGMSVAEVMEVAGVEHHAAAHDQWFDYMEQLGNSYEPVDPDEALEAERANRHYHYVGTHPRACAWCGRTGKGLMRCTKCLYAVYCNRECQLAHWPYHKGRSCRTLRADAAAVAKMPLTNRALDKSVEAVESLFMVFGHQLFVAGPVNSVEMQAIADYVLGDYDCDRITELYFLEREEVRIGPRLRHINGDLWVNFRHYDALLKHVKKIVVKDQSFWNFDIVAPELEELHFNNVTVRDEFRFLCPKLRKVSMRKVTSAGTPMLAESLLFSPRIEEIESYKWYGMDHSTEQYALYLPSIKHLELFRAEAVEYLHIYAPRVEYVNLRGAFRLREVRFLDRGHPFHDKFVYGNEKPVCINPQGEVEPSRFIINVISTMVNRENRQYIAEHPRVGFVRWRDDMDRDSFELRGEEDDRLQWVKAGPSNAPGGAVGAAFQQLHVQEMTAQHRNPSSKYNMNVFSIDFRTGQRTRGATNQPVRLSPGALAFKEAHEKQWGFNIDETRSEEEAKQKMVISALESARQKLGLSKREFKRQYLAAGGIHSRQTKEELGVSQEELLHCLDEIENESPKKSKNKKKKKKNKKKGKKK